MMVLALLAAQVLVSPPSPPMPARADTSAFEQEKARYADDLRRTCLSEKGIAIVLSAWEAGRRTGPERAAAQQAAEQEVGAAAYAPTIDADGIERSLAVRRRLNDEALSDGDARSIAVLRQLSAADRSVYARRLTILRPEMPVKRCDSGISAR